MKKVLLFALSIFACISVSAQDYFEGVITARSFEKHSDITIKFSQGMLINGARDAEMHIKGNRVAVVDKVTNVHTIYDLGNKKIYYVFYNINKAIEMPTASLQQMMAGALVPEATDQYLNVLGRECQLYTASKDTEESGAKIKQNIQIYICKELEVHPDLAPFVSQNTGLPSLGGKYVVDTNTTVPLVGQMNSYVAYEIQNISACEVDDAVFAVPAEFTVVDGTNNAAMYGVYKENAKVMKKLNKGKKAEPVTEVKFEINEDWDF